MTEANYIIKIDQLPEFTITASTPAEASRATAGIHRRNRPSSPPSGQVERMNRTIKEAIVKRFHYATRNQLTAHLADFVSAYNFARRLKTLKGLTPYERSA